MSQTLPLGDRVFPKNAVSPLRELGAYEALWDAEDASFKTIAEKFGSSPGSVPSELVPETKSDDYAKRAMRDIDKNGLTHFGVSVHGAGEHPSKLRDAKYPLQLLYYRGFWDLVFSPSVAIVGTRNPSDEGVKRTRQLVRKLVEDDFTIVSGMAAGIDREAHVSALRFGGRTVGVIGTPITKAYPRENSKLQDIVAKYFLIISQVPILRYQRQTSLINRHFFPERNITMSALTEATVIVEAGETSGTLIQARAAIDQGRKLFILDSCFSDTRLKWPQKFVEKGAIRVKSYDDIKRGLSTRAPHKN